MWHPQDFTSLCGTAGLAGAPALSEPHFHRKISRNRMQPIDAFDTHDGHLPYGICTSSYPGGTVSKPRKKLQVIVCVLFVELFERFTFFGIVCNMILFCTIKLGYSSYQAAMVNTCFVGASVLTPVLVGWFAETCLGRTTVLCFCALLHFFG